ncbi:DUF4383 domain-containing protein [Georgenia sp. SUBG003]|uniref:DUF4383 domain-containing protein n=1 Tax=Georgenia sp. SUBG003 TaxID=1497974 RepID=UPI003AB28050
MRRSQCRRHRPQVVPRPPTTLALIIGVVYLVVGIAGFFATGFSNFTEHDHTQTLLGFAVNPLHNVVHVIIGLAGVLLWRTRNGARLYGWLLGVGYGATAVYGFLVVNNPDANILNINQADNWLHVFSALAASNPAQGTANAQVGAIATARVRSRVPPTCAKAGMATDRTV